MADTTTLEVTDPGDIPNIVAATRDAFRSGRSLEIPFRKQQLKKVQELMEENKTRIFDALKHDLSKSTVEGLLMEYNIIMKDVFLFLDNLDELAAPQPHPKDLLNKLNSVYLQAEPYGVVLIIAPWNYPLQLCLLPLIGAIAAGNCCVLKPSETSIATSNLMKDLIPKYLDNDCYQVVAGATDCSKALLQERYDHIFFTGSTNVGRIVMKHAAEHITPVTLELGGKSPVLVAPDANIPVAARRIVWGKFLNAGQTCIAPDYVLCPRDKMDLLIESCKKTITEFYGEDPKQSKDYGRIISAVHCKRLLGLLEKTSGTITFGGDSDEVAQYISPTLVTAVTNDDHLMQEEIFGPILPFVAIDDVDSAIKLINDREKPLAFYVFSESSATFGYINKRTSSGGVCHNDTLMHSAIESFPFGGVGQSGMGAYHGKCTFKTFSHYKPVLSTSTGMEALNKLRYPPYSDSKLRRLEWVLGRPGPKSKFTSKLFYFFCVVAVVAVLVQTFGLPNWLYRK